MLNNFKSNNIRNGFFILIIFILASCSTSEPVTKKQTSDSATASITVSQKDTSSDKRSFINPIDPPITFKRALYNGTRTKTGEPGPNYWQQWTNYDLHAKLIPSEKKLEGSGQIVYYNNSPDTLRQLFMELDQNFHDKGTIRNRDTDDITGGIHIDTIQVDNISLTKNAHNGPGYLVDATRLMLVPDQPVAPGDSTVINIKWWFNVPGKGVAGRMGYDSDNLFFIGYWYPIMSVYDDVNGWYTDPFLGEAEFYDGYGNYNFTVQAPQNWVVMGTGVLQNAKQVLSDPVYDRMKKAEQSDKIVHVISKDDFDKATRTSPDSLLTWKFQADTVRDVAFSATTESKWDAARTPVGDRDGDGKTDYIRSDAFYRNSAPLWKDGAEFNQYSIKFLSQYTDFSYPWPHMTAVEGGGIIGGGMEYPMMTVIGDYNGSSSKHLFYVIAHELAHMWVPMMVGTNERRYSWMDEGTTTFNEDKARTARYPDDGDQFKGERQDYLRIAGTGFEGEIMRWSNYHYDSFLFGIASYDKPATVLHALEYVLGEDTFNKAYHTFIKRWAYKHPKPWDLFNTFEDVSGRDLGWFWRSWYYETWVLDQAVADVSPTAAENGYHIEIDNNGRIPMPVPLTITLKNGHTLHRNIDVDVWLDGSTSTTLTMNTNSPIVKVEIDPDHHFPDANRRNNTWQQN